MWDASKCNLCGDCLFKCQYIDYDRDKAVSQIKLLTEGKDAEILHKCITCIACYDYCPTGADPFYLISSMQEKTGTSTLVLESAPHLARRVKGLEGQGDQPSQVIPGDPDKPALALDVFEYGGKWGIPEGILDSQLFKGMTLVRGPEYYTPAFAHFGCLSLREKYTRMVIDRLASLGKDIVYFHNEGFALVHTIAKDYGITVPFKYMHPFEYLRNYLRDHQSSITKLGKKIAYQANCATRWVHDQDHFFDEVLELIGVDRPPRKYEGLNALCCGAPIISCAEFKDKFESIQKRNIRDAVECGADALVTCCPICYNVLQPCASQFGLANIFLFDLCRIALGEKPWPMG